MKILRLIKNAFILIFGLIFFTFVIGMTVLVLNYNKFGVAEINDNSLLLMKEDLSNAKYKKGDLVITEHTKITDYAVGEYVFTYRIGADRVPTIQLGKIGNVYPEEDALSFENGETYSSEYVAGKPIKQYEKIGGYLSIIQSKWGFLFIVLIPVFLIVLVT